LLADINFFVATAAVAVVVEGGGEGREGVGGGVRVVVLCA